VVKIVIDSYAWIEHFLGSEKGKKVDNTLIDADEVYTPDTVLAEVARKYVRDAVDNQVTQERLKEMTEASNIICIDANIAQFAARSYMQLDDEAKKSNLNRPSLFDALVAAVGKSLDAKVLTGDKHFKNLPETIWLE
jgi:predicted nucleic acid-binding protein